MDLGAGAPNVLGIIAVIALMDGALPRLDALSWDTAGSGLKALALVVVPLNGEVLGARSIGASLGAVAAG